MTHPVPTLAPMPYNPFSPRAIRLVRGIVTCMRCDKKCFKSTLQHGWGFQTCEHKRCDFEWWSLALPPDCFGGWLAAMVGERDAALLITQCFPRHAASPAPQLWYAQLIDGDEPAWIQVAVRPRERHLYRTAKVADFLHLLLRPAA